MRKYSCNALYPCSMPPVTPTSRELLCNCLDKRETVANPLLLIIVDNEQDMTDTVALHVAKTKVCRLGCSWCSPTHALDCKIKSNIPAIRY